MADRHNLAKAILELAKLARKGEITSIVFAATGDEPIESGYWIGVLDSNSSNPFATLGLATALLNRVSKATDPTNYKT